MALFARFPADVLHFLVRDWLGDLKVLSCLDQAVTSHALRSILSRVFCDVQLSDSQYLIERNEIVTYLQWLSSRKVRISQLAFRLSDVQAIIQVQPYLPTIRVLRVTDEFKRPSVSAEDFGRFFKLVPSVDTADLTDLSVVRDDDVLFLSQGHPMRGIRLGESSITRTALTSVLSANKDALRELSVNLMGRAGEELQACAQLRSLILCDASNSTVDLLAALPALEELALRTLDGAGVTLGEADLRSLRTRCPTLRFIDLSACTNLPPSALPHVTEIFCDARHIELADASYRCEGGERLVMLRGMKKESAVLTTLAALTVAGPVHALNLRGCCAFSPAGLAALHAHTGRDTRRLELRLGKHLRGEDLQALLARCPSMQTLFLCNALVVDDKTLACMAESCRDLRMLCLETTPEVSANGVRALLRVTGHCLAQLFLHSCPRVADDALEAIAEAGAALRVLSVQGAGVTARGLASLLASASLEHLFVDADLETALVQKLPPIAAWKARRLNWHGGLGSQ